VILGNPFDYPIIPVSIFYNNMPKIDKKTIFKFERIPVSVFKFENSKNYFVRYYIGRQKSAKSGNKDKSLKTQNKNEAKVKAKKIYFEYLTNPTPIEKEIDFNIDIAQPFFRHRIRHYKNKNPDSTQGIREKQRYDNYIHKFFEDVDYRNNEDLEDAIEELKDNLKLDNKTDNTISKYFNILSLMFRKAVENNLIKKVPYFPPLKIVNQIRHSYQNEELNLINRKLDDEFKRTEDKFYLFVKDYLNLIRSAGFRPGIEPLKIKNFQCQFVLNRETNKKDILAITLFNTKTKPKHRLFCNPFFAKNIYPEIRNRNSNPSPEDYLLFPNTDENRRKIYQKISKTFVRISKELNLYYRGGSTRPLYSIRHTFAKNNYIQNAPLKVIAKQMNTSEKMLHSAYLDDDDILLSEEFNMMYNKKKK
jgi:hypothetical protein